jgi:hypothetical protein
MKSPESGLISACKLSHRAARNPTSGPGGLEIEAAGDSINIEQFAGKVQAGTDAALHGFEVHFA